MFRTQYLIRIDDICPTMHWDNFMRLKNILENHGIQAILGIIPDNQDSKLMQHPPQSEFWEEMKDLAQKDWPIAQHGYQHLYKTTEGGILNINEKSEFAGLSYEEQKKKLSLGKTLLEEKLSQPVSWWMAPAHSFDRITCRALKELGFRYITDGIALFPFQKYGLIWIPQQLWQPKKKCFGLWTICIHPDSLTEDFLDKLDSFIGKERGNFPTLKNFTPRRNILNTIYELWWRFQYLVYKKLFK